MVLADAPPEEAFAAVTAGGPVVLASGPVPTDGAQGVDPVGEQVVGVGRLGRDGLCGQRTGQLNLSSWSGSSQAQLLC